MNKKLLDEITKILNNKDFKPDTFLSNLKKENITIALQAAYETGFDIWIDEIATNVDGYVLPSLVAIHTNEGDRDHEAFWQRYHELEEEVKNDTLLV